MGLSPQKNVCFHNPIARQKGLNKAAANHFSTEIAAKVRKFHRTIPDYQPTPLARLENLAAYLGIGGIWVKDESYRFGLNAFKVLGASYALTSALAEKFGLSRGNLSFSDFQSPEIRRRSGEITCVTATDGNHGRAVAWSAQQLGCRSVVYMPRRSSPFRLENIRKCGAEASVIDGTYDDAVRLAAEHAKKNGWLLVQDTAQADDENMTTRIMQGYLTMFEEAFEQLGNVLPTHIFVQCGVGSFPASFQAYLVERFGEQRPFFAVVESAEAACFYKSATARDGNPHKVSGDIDTIMAGLACGEPSAPAWETLRDFSDMFIACQDDVAMTGMRVMGNPMEGDQRIISGESGAVTLGLLYHLMKTSDFSSVKESLRLDHEARVLLVSTEGDTDSDMYREIVWGA